LEETLTKNQNPFKNLLNWEGLCLAPQTEQEVVILFSKLTLMLKGRWVTKSAEFEVNSSDFEEHGHLKQIEEGQQCDYIICWKNDMEKKAGKLPEIIEL
jgi:hypothetical protein